MRLTIAHFTGAKCVSLYLFTQKCLSWQTEEQLPYCTLICILSKKVQESVTSLVILLCNTMQLFWKHSKIDWVMIDLYFNVWWSISSLLFYVTYVKDKNIMMLYQQHFLCYLHLHEFTSHLLSPSFPLFRGLAVGPSVWPTLLWKCLRSRRLGSSWAER